MPFVPFYILKSHAEMIWLCINYYLELESIVNYTLNCVIANLFSDRKKNCKLIFSI